MYDYSMTVPVENERYIEKLRIFAQQTNRLTEYIETKDGFVFMFEFESAQEQESFKKSVDMYFPNLFR